MNLTTKLFKFSMFLFLVIGLSMTMYGQEELLMSINGQEELSDPDGSDDEVQSPIFETDVKGSIPRADCYDIFAGFDEDELGLSFTLNVGPGGINYGAVPCQAQMAVTILGTTYTTGVELFGTIDFSSVTISAIQAETNSPDCEYAAVIPITIQFFCQYEEDIIYLSSLQVSQLLNVDVGQSSSPFEETFEIALCCNPNPMDRIFDDEITNTHGSISDFSVINQDDSYKLMLDESFSNQNIRIDVIDIAGRILSTKNVTLGAFENSVTIDKLNNQKGIQIITVRTENEVLSKKVLNY